MTLESQPPAASQPVYRQDEFVRQPTAWTRPMQVAVAAYFAIGVVISLVALTQLTVFERRC